MESDDATVPPEQVLTEALLSLSWPLPRTVEDADAALTRLEEVRAVLTRLEQRAAGGAEAWWAGQVDALATQSGFVLEWWRPVLRDPELDWTLNHQAHLTADLATLASAGARLLDQIEPQAAEQAAAAHARRASREGRWGPTSVPALAASSGAGANVPGARPQPPAEVFGGEVAAAAAVTPAPQPAEAAAQTAQTAQTAQGTQQGTQPSAEDLEPPQFPPLPADPRAATPTPPEALNAGAARHRRPTYDFGEDASAPAPVAPVVPASPVPLASTPVPAPAAPIVPVAEPVAFAQPVPAAPPGGGSGPGSGPGQPRRPAHGYPNEPDTDDDEPARLVPTALGRHQRRLLLQTIAILAAIGVLCWWAVYTLSSGSSSPAASSGHTTGASTAGGGSTAQAGVGALSPSAPSSSARSSSAPAASQGPQSPTTSASPAPSTATSSIADATTVSSVQVTLLGGSASVPQIVALITVHTAGTGAINVTGSYYGLEGGAKVAPETDHWTFAGHTEYQYSVPIANGPYCGGTFSFTLSAGGHTDNGNTSPGC